MASKVVLSYGEIVIKLTCSSLLVACLGGSVAACSKAADCPDAGAKTVPSTANSAAPAGSNTGASVSDDQIRMRLGEALVTPEAYKQLIVESSSMLAQGLARSAKRQPGMTPERVAALVTEALPRDEVSTISAKVYEARFSREELVELLTFYESPAGAKLVSLQSEMGQEVGGRVSQVVTQRWPDLVRKRGLTPD